MTDIKERGQWDSKAEFILACMGSSIGLGNVWRFPYLAYENGGAAFLFPYIIIMMVIGKPMYLMETALGQYCQRGPLHAWACVPAMKGLGYSQVLQAIFGISQYNLLMAYSLYYMVYTFYYIGYQVPWANCDPAWSDENCYEAGKVFPCSKYNLTEPTAEVNCTNKNVSSGTQFWENGILKLDFRGLTTFGNIGEIQWQLSLCLLFAWIIAFLCVMKGIKSSGKVVYFTATFPFVALVILLIAGVTLPGATKGLKFLFIPKWDRILDVTVWRKAAAQVFYSLSLAGGVLVMFGSYNKFNNKLHYDIILISTLDFFASLLGSIAIFSVLGAMAEELNLEDVDKVVAGGHGLAFIAYPEAISRTLPVPHLWAVLFFFMLLTLGLDSLFAGMENVLTTIYDCWPHTRRYKVVITAVFTLFCFLIGFPFCGSLGPFIFYILDKFGGGISPLLYAILQCITLHWFYGVNRFSNNLTFMFGYTPGYVLKFCWAVASPVILLGLFIPSMIEWEGPVYKGRTFPNWAIAIGWCAATLSLVMIPVFLVKELIHYSRKGDWRQAFRPNPDWGPRTEASQGLHESHEMKGKTDRKEIYAADNPTLRLDTTDKTN